MTTEYEKDCEEFKSLLASYKEGGLDDADAREAAHTRLREWDRDLGSLQARRACIEQARTAAKALDDKGEAHAALMALVDEFEKVLNPRDGHIDAIYGAYLESFRFTLTGGEFIPARGVWMQAAAALGGADVRAAGETPILHPRTRQALFEAVVGLLQRRE